MTGDIRRETEDGGQEMKDEGQEIRSRDKR